MVETLDEEEEVDNDVNIIYLNQPIQKKQDMNWHSRGNCTKMIPEPCYSTMKTHKDPQVPKNTKLNSY